MADGFAVNPGALRQAARGINDTIGALRKLGFPSYGAEAGRGFGGLALRGMQVGHQGLHSAFGDFCDRWSWGVRSMGRLVPNVMLAVGTDGAGAAADVGEGVGSRAAVGAGENAGRMALRDAAGNPADVSRPFDQLPCRGEPVDVPSGDVVLRQEDVRLPAALPLAVQRVHRSSYRAGQWFGPSWASTLDQRLEVDGDGVLFAAPDAAVLFYPRPEPGGDPVLPSEGPRWPLAWHTDGSYTVTDPQAGLVRRFAPCPGHPVLASGAGCCRWCRSLTATGTRSR